jgi:hypothetical protein
MFYVISFDGCGLESPLQSRTAASALALAQEAERNGCANVVIKVPGGEPLSIDEFAKLYCPAEPNAGGSPASSTPAKASVSGAAGRAERRDRQASEVEASQDALRESIAATEKLVDESDTMLRRHRKECDDEEQQAGRE